ncbi:unnamed protein product [Dovyalis caffra]|uniref:Uncharacterized protein n=1 Tax=Dovyalis caffra TaxID=77055 RepID=A0AAV1RBM1_9ROSI|nr:unnamed protein product [Dovyalis caffra]
MTAEGEYVLAGKGGTKKEILLEARVGSAKLPKIRRESKKMVSFSAIFSCFVPPSSSRVTDEAPNKAEQPKSKSKSSGAPIVVSYFPMNSYLSRL